MKLVTYQTRFKQRLGILVNGQVYDLRDADGTIPATMRSFLQQGRAAMEKARHVEQDVLSGLPGLYPVKGCWLIAPVPQPASCRDGYAFRQHVETARRNRGLGMIPEFDQYPIFYFTNHQAVQGPGPVSCMPDHFDKLDFELEVAIVIGRKGRNIQSWEADNYIAGYMIMNDMSARTLQMEEMLLNLGPAKGKDFSTVIGPWLVTPDELEWYKVAAKPGHTGNNYNLEMACKVNGKEVSRGNMRDMDWTFAEIIERCSYGCDVFPGDVIGSGTVGTGCFLELNGTHKTNEWLKDGDVMEMEITGLGILENRIEAVGTDWSILKQKK